jgi:SNF2 family DNA or RNA helicase
MSLFKNPPPLFGHQEETVQFFLKNPRVLCFSDAGTGKTRSVIESIRQQKHLGKTLILAPKSILEPAWANDIRKFAPEITYSIARAENRKQGFAADVDVIITNFDAVQWLFDQVKAKKVPLDCY